MSIIIASFPVPAEFDFLKLKHLEGPNQQIQRGTSGYLNHFSTKHSFELFFAICTQTSDARKFFYKNFESVAKVLGEGTRKVILQKSGKIKCRRNKQNISQE